MIGDMNERISIQAVTLFDDGYSVVERYEEILNVWASVNYLSDAQRWIAQGASSNVVIRFTIRNPRIEIGIKNKIIFNGKEYYVDGVRPYRDEKDFIQITAGLRA